MFPCRGVLKAVDMENFVKARDAVLGERHLRTPDKPVLIDDEYVGGVAWEQSPHAVSIGKAARCYTAGQSYQTQRKLAAPTLGAKMLDPEEPTEHHKLCLQAVQVSIE